ncbi:MAG: FAD-dependent oxidoreductase [Gammaproteobacteria bacterium]|nr:FAD-dependent oxidoreductase [Gammaproteobacteria bacterium]
MTTRTADAVVVGAGIVGCATAYYLARAGVRAVLVDGDGIARHASGFAYGGLYPLSGAGIPGPMFALARRSFALHHELSEALPDESGFDIGFRSRPTVSLAFAEDEAAGIREHVAWVNAQAGFRAEWLSATALRKVIARIADDAVGGALYYGAAEVDPAGLTRALAQASGAEVLADVAVGLNHDGDRAIGLRLRDGGEIACGAVVLAQGPWAGAASDWLGAPVPVTPLKGEILRLEAQGPPIDCSIGWRGNYATTKPDGLLWAGTTEDVAGFDEAPTEAGRRSVLGNLVRMLPALEGARVVAQTACLRPMTPDGNVMLGRAPGLRGVYVATGGRRKGILYGPGMGAACADLVVTGATDLDLTPYDPGRFGRS